MISQGIPIPISLLAPQDPVLSSLRSKSTVSGVGNDFESLTVCFSSSADSFHPKECWLQTMYASVSVAGGISFVRKEEEA